MSWNVNYHDCSGHGGNEGPILLQYGTATSIAPYEVLRIGMELTVFMTRGRLHELANKITAHLIDTDCPRCHRAPSNGNPLCMDCAEESRRELMANVVYAHEDQEARCPTRE